MVDWERHERGNAYDLRPVSSAARQWAIDNMPGDMRADDNGWFRFGAGLGATYASRLSAEGFSIATVR